MSTPENPNTENETPRTEAQKMRGKDTPFEDVLTTWATRAALAVILVGGVKVINRDAVEIEMLPYEFSQDELKENEKINETLPKDFVRVGPNRISPKTDLTGVDVKSPIVMLRLPGKNNAGEDQGPLFREQAAEQFKKIWLDCYKRHKIQMIVNSAFRLNSEQNDINKNLPGLGASVGTGRHAIEAVDISRKSADPIRQNPLTVDVDGKILFLEEVLKTEEGGKRFAEVVIKIHQVEITKDPSIKDLIVKEWIDTLKDDYDNNVFGSMDVCMESFQKFGQQISHCGAVSNSTNPKALRESWHAQPSKAMAGCRRWDETYNANIKMYRKYPPIPEDQWLKKAISFTKRGKAKLKSWASKVFGRNKKD